MFELRGVWNFKVDQFWECCTDNVDMVILDEKPQNKLYRN